MSLFVFSVNNSKCSICGPFEGEIFSDDPNSGHPAVDEVESAGAFHDGCYHTWEPISDDEALIKQEDALLARGTEWYEPGDPRDFLKRSDFDLRMQMMNGINGVIEPGWRASIVSYTNSGYTTINRALRWGTGQARAIKNIDAAMARSTLKHDLTLWRGTTSKTMDNEILGKVLGKTTGMTPDELKRLIGHTYKDSGYGSTAVIQGGKFGGRYEIEIITPKGTRGLYVGPEGRSVSQYNGQYNWRSGVSSHTNEVEIILDRSTEFRIVDAYYSNASMNTIHLKVIARQAALDPAARLAAEKAAARVARAAAKKAATAPKPPPAPAAPVGSLPSPSSVAGALEKAGINPKNLLQVDAGWTAPNQMTLRLWDKSGTPHLHLVNFSKAEAQAAKAAGKHYPAGGLSSAAPVVQAPAAATGGTVGGTATSAATTAAGKVAASEVKQLLVDLGMTKGQLAKAVGKSPSLITEWTGGGHGNLMNVNAWPDVKAKAKAWAQSH